MLSWYDAHARVLPWRVSPADRKRGVLPVPYRVWLSEIMLQQTTVATVKTRFQRFLALWPDVAALAASEQAQVLQEWAGLGYYARARNLHKCAQTLAADYAGVFPQQAVDLQKLPGIGAYTSAAIAAIAFDQPAPVMDGNIERVMARLFAHRAPLPAAKPALFAYAQHLTPVLRPGDYAQALMDLGSLICTPRNPVCDDCPLAMVCVAKAQGQAQDLPTRRPRQAKPTRHGVAFVIRRVGDDAVLLVRRPQKGLLGGMLALPSGDWQVQQAEEPAVVTPPLVADWHDMNSVIRHTFTHFHLVLAVWQVRVPARKAAAVAARLEGEWHLAAEQAGLPTVFKKVLMQAASLAKDG